MIFTNFVLLYRRETKNIVEVGGIFLLSIYRILNYEKVVITMKELCATVFVISDSVGETASFVVNAVSTQFLDHLQIHIERYSYVESVDEIEEILQVAKENSSIIAYTIVIPTLKEFLDKRAKELQVIVVDLLEPLMNAFSTKLQIPPNYKPKLLRQLNDDYFRKIEAVEFAVKYDDGKDARGVFDADIVLIGISRTSKTPLSMYLGYKGYKVANVPLIPEVEVPEELFKVSRNKCVGLIISPQQLNIIRTERLKQLGIPSSSNYASEERILEELDYAEKIMKRIGCPVVDVSEKAIEETAENILEILNLRGK